MKKLNQRIGVTVTPEGVDMISFLTHDKQEALEFYRLIEPEIEDFQSAIIRKVRSHAGNEDAEHQ